MGKKIYIIAGEASGDLHASNLIKSLKTKVSDLQFRGWGGDLMQEQGVELVTHYRDVAFMGFIEVVKNLRTILSSLKKCKKDIQAFQPDCVVLVDYPGFNLRIAEFVHQLGIPVVYYISPQVWAWKQNRIKKIKQHVDLMLTILPFEQAFYEKFDFKAEYVGHPLLDAITVNSNTENYIALLPGSRTQEIDTMLPIMNEVASRLPNEQFVVVKAPSKEVSFYESFISASNIKLSQEGTSKVLNGAKAALVTSGTATLETALYNVPQVVCYKGSYVTYQIAKRLVKLDYISLVNLILDKPAIKELIQDDFTPESLHMELLKIIDDSDVVKRQLSDYKELRDKLGGEGASDRAAEHLLRFLPS